jgi:ABC-type sugar transport system permease subunit
MVRRPLIDKNDYLGWLLCLPALLVFAIFFLWPALMALRTSFYRWTGFTSDITFIGIENYKHLINNKTFFQSLKINVIVAIAVVFLKIPVGFLVAYGLSKTGVGKRLFRTSIFVPHMLSPTVVATLWVFSLDPYRGLVNEILRWVGLESFTHGWLTEVDTALISAILIAVWWTFGIHAVIFMAGLAGIPSEYHDAARLETKNPLQIIRYVTIPMLREQFFISFILAVGSAFGYLVGLFSVMTKGGPANRTQLLGILQYHVIFEQNQAGVASAITVMILTIVILITIIPTISIARSRLEY